MNTGFLTKACLALLTYFLPIATMIHVVLIFIAIDFITGIYASYKCKVKIVSKRLRNTVEKFVCYCAAIIIAYLFQNTFADWTHLSVIVSSFIALTEMLSIFENINKITKLDIASKVKNTLQDTFKQIISKNERDLDKN